MNKKAGVGELLGGALIFILTIAVVLVILNTQGVSIPFISTPDANAAISASYNGAINFVTWIKDLAVPEGLSDGNLEMIAFAMFLLIWIIGAKSLKHFFKSPIISGVVSFLIALIAARGLNSTIINDYVVGSPVAAGAFIVGVIPILMFYGFMEKIATQFKELTRFLFWCLFALIYFLVFTYGFQSMTLGITYLVVILIAGIIETLSPFIMESARFWYFAIILPFYLYIHLLL